MRYSDSLVMRRPRVTWLVAAVVAGTISAVIVDMAYAADVDITSSTNDGISLDSFVGVTAQVASGITVNNTTFTIRCGTFSAICATAQAWTLTNNGTIGPPNFGNGVNFTDGGAVVNFGSIDGGNGILIGGGAGASVDNKAGATIHGSSGAIVIGDFFNPVAGVVTNAGTITSDGQAVGLNGGGIVTNLAGALIQGLALGCAYFGLQHGVSAGISGLINGLAPLFTALGAVPFLGERIGPRQWLGLSAGLIGVVLVVIDRVSLGGANWEGYAVTFAALLALSAGTLYQKKHCSDMDLRTGSFIQVAVASALVFLPALRFEGLEVEWNWTLILASAWLSLANSIGAFTLLYVLLRKGEASRVSALFYLVPPITAIMGFAVFHETLSPVALLGFAITVAGVYLGTRQDAS